LDNKEHDKRKKYTKSNYKNLRSQSIYKNLRSQSINYNLMAFMHVDTETPQNEAID